MKLRFFTVHDVCCSSARSYNLFVSRVYNRLGGQPDQIPDLGNLFFFFFVLLHVYLAVQVASKSLMDTLNEMYESQWVGHDHMCTYSNNLDMLWSDYSHKLADQVLIPLNTYQAQFAETRVRRERERVRERYTNREPAPGLPGHRFVLPVLHFSNCNVPGIKIVFVIPFFYLPSILFRTNPNGKIISITNVGMYDNHGGVI